METRFPLLALAASLLAVPAPALAQGAPAVKKQVEADGTSTLVHEIVVEASAQAVWAAISTAEGWKTWAVPAAWGSEPDIIETSYDPAAAPGSPGTIRQQLLFRVPNRMLVFRTVKAPEKFPHWESYRKVSSVFELEPLGERRTRVRLTGVGYPGTPEGRQLVAFFERGNAASLEWLRARFVEGPADWKKRLAKK